MLSFTFRVDGERGQYLYGHPETGVATEIPVTVMVTPIVSTHCRSAPQQRMGTFRGTVKPVLPLWLQPTAVVPVGNDK